MATKKRISFKTDESQTTLSTAKKASITASLVYSRGKELVEHNPWDLIPDPNNPRPGEIIDDQWLKRVLKLGEEGSLCYKGDDGWVIPSFEELSGDLGGVKQGDYDYLVQLALSLRTDGIIHPIEIFLADKRHEPEYFTSNNLDHGYVILEGHQRRLAAIIAGLDQITCVKLTDDTLLAKLKIKHRKLRRQLSENNIRKQLTAGQQYTIVKMLIESSNDSEISTNELVEITGLNIKYIRALKRVICSKVGEFPSVLYEKLLSGEISLRILKQLVSKSFTEIVEFFDGSNKSNEKDLQDKKKDKRGAQGGRLKRSVTFKINNESETKALTRYLTDHFDYLHLEEHDSSYKQLEHLLKQILDKAKKETT